MRAVRSRDTGPELTLRSHLHRLGFRFRLHVGLPGRPDLYLSRYGAAVFVHGCFWHHHPGCPRAKIPRSNTGYWNAKLRRNVERDAQAMDDLRIEGIEPFVIWECELQRDPEATANELAGRLRKRLERLK